MIWFRVTSNSNGICSCILEKWKPLFLLYVELFDHIWLNGCDKCEKRGDHPRLKVNQQLFHFDSSFFTYFGAISLKRMRRFDLLTTDLGHALVVCD